MRAARLRDQLQIMIRAILRAIPRLLTPVVLAAALLAGGCGGGDEKPSAAEWADNLCSAVTDWKGSIASAVDSVKGNISEDGLRNAADDVKNANETLVDDLKGLGTPETEAGDKAKSSVDELRTEIEQDSDKMQNAVDDAKDASSVLSAVSVVSGTLQTMGRQVSSTVTEVRQLDATGELKDAFEQSDSCTSLRQSGS